MTVRLATPSDLDAMTWVLIGASPLDPIYPYRFPDRHLYPSEFAALCRRKCAEYLATSTVVVCEMPIDPSNPHDTRVVAFSAWDMPTTSKTSSSFHHTTALESSSSSSSSSHLRETSPKTLGNVTRQHLFRTTLAHWKAHLFDTQFPSHLSSPGGQTQGHVFLKILLTHPAYQRLGAGTALTQWGITQARDVLGGLPTTVFASPMGLRLYLKLGFVEVTRFKVQLEGEGEFLEIPALVLMGDNNSWNGGRRVSVGDGWVGRRESLMEAGGMGMISGGMERGDVVGMGCGRRRRVAGEHGEGVVGCA